MVQNGRFHSSQESPSGELRMYIVFLMATISVFLVMAGRRGLAVTATMITVITAAVMLYVDMTTRLQISL